MVFLGSTKSKFSCIDINYYQITLVKTALFINLLQFYRLLFMLGLSKVDPTTQRFSEIFSSAASSSQMPNGVNNNPEKKVSAWPILTFLGLIFATPYLIMKLIGQVSTTALEECKKAVRSFFSSRIEESSFLKSISNQHIFLYFSL